MNLRLIQISFAVALAVHGLAQADDTNSQTGPLGKVSFPTSCDSKVQPAFERAVAMLHSFWYSAGEKAFRDVLKDDPQCAIAAWGIASILMSNPLAGVKPGDVITVESRRGSISLYARADEGTPPGAIFIPFCYYKAAANTLTNPALDPVGKIPEFKYCAVKVSRGGQVAPQTSFGGGQLLSPAEV